MDPILPLLSSFLWLSVSTKSDNAPLVCEKTCNDLAVVSSSSSHKHKSNDRSIIEKVNSKFRSDMVNLISDDEEILKPDMINLVKDDENRIPLRDILTRVAILTPLFFCGPGLELRDENLEKEELRVRNSH